MQVRAELEAAVKAQISKFTASDDFQSLCSGNYSKEEYDAFISQVVRTHVRSPKLVAFLFSIAPPGTATDNLQHNLLEELGIEEEEGISHPDLLNRLLKAVDLTVLLPRLIVDADDDLRRYTSDPLLYGTLKEIGFAVLVETVAFEYMLSRCATRIANALHQYRGISQEDLIWFTHHSEVDIGHAEQGLDNAQFYAQWYDMPERETRAIIEMTFRENIFLKRYFDVLILAKRRGLA